jgi:hypothetical protein
VVAEVDDDEFYGASDVQWWCLAVSLCGVECACARREGEEDRHDGAKRHSGASRALSCTLWRVLGASGHGAFQEWVCSSLAREGTSVRGRVRAILLTWWRGPEKKGEEEWHGGGKVHGMGCFDHFF